MRALRAAGLLGAGLLLLPALASAAPPVLSFEPQAVLAQGVTPKGKVVWFSIAREISRQATTIVPRLDILADDDGDGAVRFPLDRDVPLRSIWCAVDLASGDVALATPEGFPLLEKDWPGGAIPAALNRLDLARSFAYLVAVRPGVGAWTLRAGDGGASDEDGEADGNLRAALARFTPVAASPAVPEHLAPGDLLIVIDPNRMEILKVRMGKPGAAQ